ncbi:polysaccharide pyruvyl transferase family protein [Peribacillus glennii]|uniref:Polysaccharide pyruvyl transferase family protein n=1 Tax=Peribacillus glennii TaxID=2303991 RepID=A0A372LHQ7_9BACI|nr:polysaccharide pyruvyl transferase family protein [Peribacillus glennii]RFU65821.1 polysaccharide pyruvyl transferase family protein [Peribacillus glennii]
MKKVMVYAYTTFNLGDDLFIKVLCERYPNTKFYLYAPKEYKTLFKEKNNVTIVPRDSFMIRGINFALKAFKTKAFFRRLAAQSCDMGVYIGGSLFIQGEKWREALQNVRNMRVGNKPFFLLGANFGPFQDRDFYLEYKELFKDYTDICFREKYSYDQFNDLPNVRMASDILFQMRREGINQEKNNHIVMSVIKPSRKNLANYDEVYYKKMKDIAVYFIERGYEVTLMSFCELEGDKEAVETIVDRIPDQYVTMVNKHFYKWNIEETLEIIAKSSFGVATRFHAMILGWVYNKPVFPIVYSDKMTNVMNDVGFKGNYTDFSSIDSLKAEDVFKSMETNVIDVSNQAINAEKHFEVLDNYLS